MKIKKPKPKKAKKSPLAMVQAALGRGETTEAVRLARALAQDSPHDAAIQMQAAQILCVAGDYAQALAAFKTVCTLEPLNGDAWKQRGWLHDRAGDLAAALSCYDTALRLAPGDVAVLQNAGLAQLRLKNNAAAITYFRRAVDADPALTNSWECAFQIARLMADSGDDLMAIEIWVSMLKKRQDDRVMLHLSFTLRRIGQVEAALDMSVQALLHSPEKPLNQNYFVMGLRGMVFSSFRDDVFKVLEYCLVEGRSGFTEVFRPWLSLLKLNPDFAEFSAVLSGETAADLSNEAAAKKLLVQANSPYVRYGLKYMVVHDVKAEAGLTALRRQILQHMQSKGFTGDSFGAAALPFLCALAEQSAFNEYIFAETQAEDAAIAALESRLGDLSGEDLAAGLALYACYRPLQGAALAGPVARARDIAGLELASMLGYVVDERAHAKQGAPDIRRIGDIRDDVSQAVQGQYEENPYPLWRGISLFEQAQGIPAPKQGRKILIAGCGTGRHAAIAAVQNPDGLLTALDLSGASLGYAQYKTAALNIRNVTFVQGDILDAAELGETFDHIESAGVLHHMRDPMAGWRVLTGILKPGGTMRIALYSELGRRAVVMMRGLIAEKGFAHDLGGIRAARAYVARQPADSPLHDIELFRDYFATSACRDLIFHVQEHRFTLPQIKDCVAQLGLVFKSMSFQSEKLHRIYAGQNPQDAKATDIDLLHAFELEHPLAFQGMYQFDLLKPMEAAHENAA